MTATNQELAALVRGGDAEAQTEAIARLIEALPNQRYHLPPVAMIDPRDIKSLDRLSLTELARLRVEIDRKIDGKVVLGMSPNWEQAKKQAKDVEALLCPCENHTHEP